MLKTLPQGDASSLVGAAPSSRREGREQPRVRGARWRPSALTVVGALVAVVGVAIFSYPSAAAWVSSLNQSQAIRDWTEQVKNVSPLPAEQLRLAHEYNDALSAGVALEVGANVPTGTGTSSDESLRYRDILSAGPSGLMSRIRIPAIDVDLPIYHGTSDRTLLQGAGHLEGSHLPVGGPGTHAVITAHRGLADARMFSDLDQIRVGDTFTLETFGEVLTYRVLDTKVVQPEDTDTLRPAEGEDLVTLVTCTPLGINSHRILVTGERITPTPVEDLDTAGKSPQIPGFPWWALWLAAALLLAIAFVWRAGYTDARPAAERHAD